jgi:hypothetical protein
MFDEGFLLPLKATARQEKQGRAMHQSLELVLLAAHKIVCESLARAIF